MATHTDFSRFCRKTEGLRCDKAGIYAIQPAPIANPPVKVGMAYNLLEKMARYSQAYPTGFKIHAVARVATRDPNYVRSRDDAVLAEKDMLGRLQDVKAMRKEWIKPEAVGRAVDALKAAHVKYTHNTALEPQVYTAETLNPRRRLRGKQAPPPEPPKKRHVGGVEDPKPKVKPVTTQVGAPAKPVPPKKRRLGLTEKEMRAEVRRGYQGGILLTGKQSKPLEMRKRTRAGTVYGRIA